MYKIKIHIAGEEDGTTEVLEYINNSRDNLIFDAGRMLGELEDVLAIELFEDDNSQSSQILYDVDRNDWE